MTSDCNVPKALVLVIFLNDSTAETCQFDLKLERLLTGSSHRNPNIECVLGAHSGPTVHESGRQFSAKCIHIIISVNSSNS